VLDQLHDSLEPNDIKVRIKVLNHSVAGCPCIRHFRSPDGWVPAGTILRRRLGGTHHSNVASLHDRVTGDVALDLKVVFDGVSIGGCC
jgi:hypothetical protein